MAFTMASKIYELIALVVDRDEAIEEILDPNGRAGRRKGWVHFRRRLGEVDEHEGRDLVAARRISQNAPRIRAFEESRYFLSGLCRLSSDERLRRGRDDHEKAQDQHRKARVEVRRVADVLLKTVHGVLGDRTHLTLH